MTAVIQFLNTHFPAWRDWVALTRFDRPIGSYLLLGPTLWALWIAAEGFPDFSILIIFVLGVFLMRSAGCIINDYADRNVDGFVKRTESRPLATGRLTPKQALKGFALLVGLAFLLVLLTNKLTVYLSFVAVGLAALYPFMKRYTHLPQVFLGAAYSMCIPMAFAAQTNSVPQLAWLLFAANLAWTIAYDTLYAMVDRDDDVNVGIKSTAILFGDLDLPIIGMLYGFTVLCLWSVMGQIGGTWPAYLGLSLGAVFSGYIMWSVRDRSREACFQAFLHNYWFGLLIWAGLVLNYALI